MYIVEKKRKLKVDNKEVVKWPVRAPLQRARDGAMDAPHSGQHVTPNSSLRGREKKPSRVRRIYLNRIRLTFSEIIVVLTLYEVTAFLFSPTFRRPPQCRFFRALRPSGHSGTRLGARGTRAVKRGLTPETYPGGSDRVIIDITGSF